MHQLGYLCLVGIGMLGISLEIIIHKLNINSGYKPIHQKKRSFAPERQKGIDEEVNKLLIARSIREAHYLDWFANVVMVRKVNRKWRICINYTNLNKANSKDSFLLSKIDQLVDTIFEHKLLSFMDAFLGYNQIRMVLEDEENIIFMTQ